MNKLDKQYQDLLQDILDNGVTKQDRTGTGTISVFGRQIRHNMKDGFPLLTTKKMPFKTIVTELLWFLQGNTNIKYLVDNNCHIWDGDAYQSYLKRMEGGREDMIFDKETFINEIKNNNSDHFWVKQFGELGPIYGKQWRRWETRKLMLRNDVVGEPKSLPEFFEANEPIDQIQNLINDLKTNPDSRRLMVNAWNVGELDQMVLPPCHYGFQVYTRELSLTERVNLFMQGKKVERFLEKITNKDLDKNDIPARAISLMWNQRSVDTFLGLPFNIASYGLLLEIIAKEVNMVPDELIGNLGDVHLYSNHIEQAKEQIGRLYTHEERRELLKQAMGEEKFNYAVSQLMPFGGGLSGDYEWYKIPYHSRNPFPLPRLKFSPCPITGIDMDYQSIDQFQIENYESHPTIKAPLSN